MKVMEEVTQMLDDHIVMTQSMSFSPYKKAFEERIASWEVKLVMTQVGHEKLNILIKNPHSSPTQFLGKLNSSPFVTDVSGR